MTRLALIGAIVLAMVTLAGAETRTRTAGHITSQTSTHIVTGVTGQSVYVDYVSVCVDAGGATTGIAIKDTSSSPVNLVGTSVVFALLAGQCLELFADQMDPTTPDKGLDIVTTVGNGPVEYNVRARQR